MIHIILTILKIAGILLAAIVLFLLLVILLVLFVPLRYRIDGKKYGMLSEAEAGVRIRWLLGTAEMQFRYQRGQMTAGVRILWIKRQLTGDEEIRTDSGKEQLDEQKIQLDSGKEQLKDKALRQKEEVPGDEKKINPDKNSEEDAPKEMNDDFQRENESGNTEFHTDEKKSSTLGADPAEASEGEEKRKHFHLPDIMGVIKEIISRIKGFIKKLTDTKQSLEEKWKLFRRYLSFLRSEMTKEVLGILKNHVFYLLRHIRPRKMEGTLHFGMEDPSTTGQLTGVLYLLLPAYCYRVVLQPDFEKNILEGELHIAGHIRSIHLLKVGLKIFFNKKLRAYWKRINQLRRKQ